jgi:hypothetical protein
MQRDAMTGRAPLRVVLDTNAWIPDFWWFKPHANALRNEAHSGHIQLVLPEVVRLEVLNHYREDMEHFRSTIEKLRRENRRLNLHLPEPANFDLAGHLADFARALQVFFSIGSTRIAALPTVPHEALIERALAEGFHEVGYTYAALS